MIFLVAFLACAVVVSAACPDLTPEELTKLFNKPIKSARFVGRKGSWSGVAGKRSVERARQRVTTTGLSLRRTV
jgi:hypothetical protein